MKIFKINIFSVLLILLVQNACVTNYGETEVDITTAPLAVQVAKDTTLSNTTPHETFNASLATLKNAGYRIDDSDAQSGFISAKSTESMIDPLYASTELTLFISKSETQAGDIDIRINALRDKQAVNDASFYQSLFAGIQEKILMEKTVFLI